MFTFSYVYQYKEAHIKKIKYLTLYGMTLLNAARPRLTSHHALSNIYLTLLLPIERPNFETRLSRLICRHERSRIFLLLSQQRLIDNETKRLTKSVNDFVVRQGKRIVMNITSKQPKIASGHLLITFSLKCVTALSQLSTERVVFDKLQVMCFCIAPFVIADFLSTTKPFRVLKFNLTSSTVAVA